MSNINSAALDEITKKTIEIYSKLIKKPPLTQKLLSKPPFRYLHDLFSEVIKSTGFAGGLYNDHEMSSENIKDKDSKIAYLQKMIQLLSQLGEKVRANPLKIVAGLEPEETNMMLQSIGKLVLKKTDTTSAVQTITGKAPLEEKELERPKTSKSKSNVNLAEDSLPVHQKYAMLTRQPSHKKQDTERVKAEQMVEKDPPSRAHTPSRSKTPTLTKQELKPEEKMEKEDEEQEQREEQPTIAVPVAKRRERPMSARPPPPKIKQAEVEESTNAPPLVPIAPQTQDDDDEFIVRAVDDEPAQQTTEAQELDGQHGGLVQKILQSKKQQDSNEPRASVSTAKGAVTDRDIQFLRESIQALCQSTNPLGKTLDYLQEDVDAMNKEFEMWKREYGNFKIQAQEQEKLTKEAIVPLEETLTLIEKDIEEQVKKITQLKSEILLNDQTIGSMMKNIVPMN